MQNHRFGRWLIALAMIAISGAGAASPAAVLRTTRAATAVNAIPDARLGLNVDDLARSASVVFTDAMKQAAPWSSDRALPLDAAGNVTRLAPGQSAQTVIYPFAAYPAGDYTLLYSGSGSFAVDAGTGSISAVAPGEAVVHVTPRPGTGIRLRLTATDPANYVRDVRLILPGFAASYRSVPFAPSFLARLAPFNVLRFAHWSHGDTSAVALSWPQRPAVSQFTQAGPSGVAWEYQIALANAAGADPWFVVPAGATNFYVTQLAALVHARLDQRLHPMFEYADGAWRPGSATNAYAVMAGRNFALAPDAQTAAVRWYTQRSSQLFALAGEVYGSDAGRIVRVLGGPAALPGTPAAALAQAILGSPAAQHADTFAVDASAASPAGLAYTRSLLTGKPLTLTASGGAAAFGSESAVAPVTQAALAAWRTAGGGLFAASSVTSALTAAGTLAQIPADEAPAIDALRLDVFAAYARAFPTARIAAAPLAAPSVFAPMAHPNTYVPRGAAAALRAPSAAAATDVIAIDAGGGAVSAWSADKDYSGKGNYTYAVSAAVSTSGVTNPAPAAVYQSQRTGTVTYTLPGLAAGHSYTLRLHFAELFFTAAGQRVFNVSVNGAAALAKLDVFKAAGGKDKALIEPIAATANSAGQVVVAFTAVTNNPIVNGVELQTSGTVGPTPTPAPTATPTSAPGGTAADVTTYHNDNRRTGWNASETILNTANVASGKFGLRRTLSVDGLVLAQPLFVANYAVGGAKHNVLVVATEHDSVYAFDADSGAVLWRRSLGTPQSSGDVGCGDIEPEYGITSTPAIDRASGTIYVVFATEPSKGNFQTGIVGLDLGSGNNKIAPVAIAASARQSNGSTVAFNGKSNMQRPALLLANNSLYLGFGSHCDFATSTISGWLMRYSATNLARLSAFNTVEDGVRSGGTELGSIWGTGFGPAADAAGNVYTATGNGAFDASSGGHNYSMSVLRFAPDLSKGVQDWFAYADEAADSDGDNDFGSGGVMLLPPQSGSVPSPLTALGKSGNLYLLNQSNLGHYSGNNAGALQALNIASDGNGIWGGPAYYNGPNGPTVYYQTSLTVMRAFGLRTGSGKPQLVQTAKGPRSGEFGGATPVVSSHGSAAGSGIVWTIDQIYNHGNAVITRLDAYDATNVGHLLFGATAGSWSHGDPNAWVTPLVANGKVYAGAYKTVSVFGLAP